LHSTEKYKKNDKCQKPEYQCLKKSWWRWWFSLCKKLLHLIHWLFCAQVLCDFVRMCWEYVVNISRSNALWISYNKLLNQACQELKCQRKQSKTWNRRLSILNSFQMILINFNL